MSAHAIALVGETIGTALAAASAAYAWVALWANGARRRRDAGRAGGTPQPVTVLKPLCGAEPGLYGNLRSFCAQVYPQFQVVFGVRDPADPAVEVVRQLQRDFPDRDLALVVDPRVHGINLKASNLINMLPRARHDWLVLADSDIRVSPHYLECVAAPLADPHVGIVTCLYRGAPRGGVWSRIGTQFIDAWFAPSVRLAHRFGSTRFSFGATIALRRDALEAIGGFESVKDVLADDFWLGEYTRQKGLRTVLSEVVVTTDVIESTFGEVWAHELRWMRTIRGVAPAGFAGMIVTFTFPVLTIGAALARTPLCLGLAAAGAFARLALHVMAGLAIRDRGPRRDDRLRARRIDLLLVPVRDTLLLCEWAAALASFRVQWRGQSFDSRASQ